MTSNKYKDVPIFCKAATSKGHKLLKSLGFVDGAYYPDGCQSAQPLMQCTLPTPRDRKPYDTYVPDHPQGSRQLGIKVVHNSDEFLKVLAIRGACYIGDQYIPYHEDVDGNDYTATHLLGYVGNEPAGCLRMRYFRDFVKFERLAVLSHFRGRLAPALVKAAIAFAQEKGYSQFYGHASGAHTKFWEHFGFRMRSQSGMKYLTDEVYYEMDLQLEPSKGYLTPKSGAAILVRPEGQWDRPGILETSQNHETDDERFR